MSRKKLLYLTLPASLALVLTFQNCSNNNFVPLSASGNSNLGSSVPGSGDELLPGVPGPVTTVPDPADAGRRILSVCPTGCTYSMPSQAAAAAMDGDIIEVAAAQYNDCFDLTKSNVKLRGVKGRAHLIGKVCAGKSEINIASGVQNTVIENFEFSGMANASTNGSGIRHQGIGLIVRNSYFHDGEEGILSEGTQPVQANDTVLVENCKFERLGGGGGYAHAVYFGYHKQVVVRNSQMLSSRDQGHEFKCRAQTAQLNCNQLASLDGLDSYTLNFPSGGNVAVTNSIVEQGSGTSNGVIVSYGDEMGATPPWTANQMAFTNVSFINDRNSGTYFNVINTTQLVVANSQLIGGGTLAGNQTPTLVNSPQVANRAAAGLPAYPALPVPAGCGVIGLLN